MVKVENLVKNYNEFHLECSLELRPGMVTGLIGQNGAGKSTIFKAILGLIFIDSGEIRVFGKDSRKLDKQRLGVVLSDSGFSGYLCVKDLVPVLRAFYKGFREEYFLAQCERFRVPLNKQIREFSTGMKAKLKVLAAVSHGAELLILDEPTAGLDVVAREDVLDMLRDFMEEDEKRSILISSHISSDLEGLCDDFYMIHEGRIVLHEETDVLLDEYGIIKAEERDFTSLDQQYILKTKKEKYGYQCLTNQRQFYAENYPRLVVEKGSIDELMIMMIRGEDK